MKTLTKWIDGLQFVSNSEKGQGLVLASSADNAIPTNGVSPMELLLHATAGCSAMDVISILQKKRQAVKGFTIEAIGERATEHPKVFTKIEVVYRFTGTALDPTAVEQAIRLSEEKYCSVMAMMRKACEIHTRYEIAEE